MLHKRYFYFSSQASTKIEQDFWISNKNIKKILENNEKEGIESAFSVIEQNLFVFLPEKAKTGNCFWTVKWIETTDYEYYTYCNQEPFNH